MKSTILELVLTMHGSMSRVSVLPKFVEKIERNVLVFFHFLE